MFLIPLGILAGSLTTFAGIGGGVVLVLILSLVTDPKTALAVSAPALLVGNLHRLHLFREHLDRRAALAFMGGAIPGAFLGGLVAVKLPTAALHWVLVGATALALARAVGAFQFRASPRVLVPFLGTAGVGVGFVSAGAGPALLTAPVLLATGLSGPAYIATSSLCAAAMHFGRLSAYGVGGLMTREVIGHSALLTVGILAGNFVASRLRRFVPTEVAPWIEHGALIVAVTLAITGIAK